VHYREELLLVAVAGKLVYRKKRRRKNISIEMSYSICTGWICCRRPHADTHTQRDRNYGVTPSGSIVRSNDDLHREDTHSKKDGKRKKRNSEKHVKTRRRKTVYVYKRAGSLHIPWVV
jgi:hypothetical protein